MAGTATKVAAQHVRVFFTKVYCVREEDDKVICIQMYSTGTSEKYIASIEVVEKIENARAGFRFIGKDRFANIPDTRLKIDVHELFSGKLVGFVRRVVEAPSNMYNVQPDGSTYIMKIFDVPTYAERLDTKFGGLTLNHVNKDRVKELRNLNRKAQRSEKARIRKLDEPRRPEKEAGAPEAKEKPIAEEVDSVRGKRRSEKNKQQGEGIKGDFRKGNEKGSRTDRPRIEEQRPIVSERPKGIDRYSSPQGTKATGKGAMDKIRNEELREVKEVVTSTPKTHMDLGAFRRFSGTKEKEESIAKNDVKEGESSLWCNEIEPSDDDEGRDNIETSAREAEMNLPRSFSSKNNSSSFFGEDDEPSDGTSMNILHAVKEIENPRYQDITDEVFKKLTRRGAETKCGNLNSSLARARSALLGRGATVYPTVVVRIHHSELFQSLIINDQQFMEIDRLCCELRSSL